ncbi:MAG: DegT/DnrJ/EryC1/StrS family aminotransferase [Bdellovibrionota bacterium]
MYEIGKEELSALEDLFITKKFFRYQGSGVETQTTFFEKEFSSLIGMNHSLFVTSGTNALILAMEAMGIGEGDEVIIPTYTFIATANAVLSVKAIPVLCGTGNGLTLDPESLKVKITSKTKAIIPVHMDGLPCDMDAIMKIASEKNLIVIEDVAQAVGGSYRGKRLGSIGDAGCFSFNVDKIISCGEGGLVTFRKEEHYKKSLKLHDTPVAFGMTFKEYLSDLPPSPAHSMRVSEIQSAMMRVQLKRLDPILKTLRQKKQEWRKAASLLESSDPAGDCGTTVHFNLGDPNKAVAFAQNLTREGIIAVPLYAKPAHCFWQWSSILGLTENESKRLSFELADERMKLSSIVRVNVDYQSSVDEQINKIKGYLF